jgi:hypothetical protein
LVEDRLITNRDLNREKVLSDTTFMLNVRTILCGHISETVTLSLYLLLNLCMDYGKCTFLERCIHKEKYVDKNQG